MIIPANWSLPETIRARLGGTTYGRQRAIAEEGHLVLVLHKPPGPHDTKREGTLYWRSPAGEWLASRGNGGLGGLKRHVQGYADLEAELTAEYEAADDVTTLFTLLERLTPVARAARNMAAALQAAREAVKGDTALVELRDASGDVDRNLEILLDDVRNAIAYRTAREAQTQARLSADAVVTGHRLNVLAALFLPVTAVAGLFGMNVTHGLEGTGTTGFWIVLAVSVALGVGVLAWVLAKPPAERRPRKKPEPPNRYR